MYVLRISSADRRVRVVVKGVPVSTRRGFADLSAALAFIAAREEVAADSSPESEQ